MSATRLQKPGKVRFELGWRAAKKCYSNLGRAEREQVRFPKLQEQIAEVRKKLRASVKYPDAASRQTPEFRKDLEKVLLPKISGYPVEQAKLFEEVCAAYPEVFWLEGCAPPLVRNYKIHFRLKEGAVPVARQPIPLSPYDDMRV